MISRTQLITSTPNINIPTTPINIGVSTSDIPVTEIPRIIRPPDIDLFDRRSSKEKKKKKKKKQRTTRSFADIPTVFSREFNISFDEKPLGIITGAGIRPRSKRRK